MELLTLIIHNVFAFIVILSIIVFIHEYGHYWVAKKAGVKIETFSIGFGRELFGWNDKHGTRWKVSLIPLGGYVKMFGDDGAASTPDNDKMSQMTEEEKNSAFHLKPLRWRFLIVLAGPAANFLFAMVILAIFFFIQGRPETLPKVAAIQEGSAAEQAGLQVGDLIVEMDGKTIDRFEELRSVASMHPGIEIPVKYKRGDEVIETTIMPKKVVKEDIMGNEIESGLIGIQSQEVTYKEMGVLQSTVAAVQETYDITAKTLEAVGQMIVGQRDSDQISGILRIADYSGKSMEMGLRTVLWFMTVLSINLGLVNLFPIPMLDGGHLFFYIIEGIRGKALSDRTQEYFFRFGFFVLIGLMVFATFNDLRHFKIL